MEIENNNIADKKLAVKMTMFFTIGVLFIFSMLIALFYINVGFNFLILSILGTTWLSIVLALFLIKKEKHTAAKFIVSLIPPYAVLLASVITKQQDLLSNIYTYLTPRFLVLLYPIVPIIFFGIHKKKQLIISLIILAIPTLFFEVVHDFFGIYLKDIEYVYEFHPIFILMSSVFLIFTFLAILTFQKTNLLYRKKIKSQHLEVFAEKEEIAKLNTELQFQSNLYKILELVSQNKNLYFVLQDVLNEILSINQLKIEQKGLIFLTNQKGDLEIVAQKNVEVLNKTCSIIKKGQCLCGQVLESKEKIFCDSVGHNHTIIPEGMTPHGHYVIPIKNKSKVLGVINIYTKQGAKKEECIEHFLEAVANILSRKITLVNTSESLKLQSLQLKEKSKIVTETLTELNQSIEYAEFLQKSLIPNKETINTFFKESSVLFLPKDKVSGDFYFAHNMGDNLYFGVADCTGHGIPGSFLAAMSIEAIKSTIIAYKNAKPNVILEELREIAKDRFSVNFGDKRSDSMDASMCMYNKENDLLYFAAGFMDLLIIRQNEIIETKGTKCPIGTYPIEPLFELHQVKLEKGDVIYLASDGYVDQFGMLPNKAKPTKLKRKRFKELLLKNAHLKCDEQVEILKQNIIEWRGDIEQIDDVTVFIARH